MLVKATREGLVGRPTATGTIIDLKRLGCALPSRKYLHRHVTITNPRNGHVCVSECLDVGPWNTNDDYLFHGTRPESELGLHVTVQGNQIKGTTNGAGIDLWEATWFALGMTDNDTVDVELVSVSN